MFVSVYSYLWIQRPYSSTTKYPNCDLLGLVLLPHITRFRYKVFFLHAILTYSPFLQYLMAISKYAFTKAFTAPDADIILVATALPIKVRRNSTVGFAFASVLLPSLDSHGFFHIFGHIFDTSCCREAVKMIFMKTHEHPFLCLSLRMLLLRGAISSQLNRKLNKSSEQWV